MHGLTVNAVSTLREAGFYKETMPDLPCRPPLQHVGAPAAHSYTS